MQFGHLDNIDGVDFRLSNDHRHTLRQLQQHARLPTPKVYLGCTGWGMKEWVGTYYPKGAKPDSFLKEYGKQFNTIELNATHYKVPNEETILKWAESTPEGFRFCPKMPQSLSHSRDLGIHNALLLDFAERLQHLGSRLGPVFVQLPSHYGPEKIFHIERFLQTWPFEKVPLSIEARHEGFFNDPVRMDEYFDLLERYGCSALITDVSGRRDVLHQRLTTPTLMLRFVGNALHATDYQRLDEWALKLKEWFDAGLQEAFIFLHQPNNHEAPQIVSYFCAKLNEVLHLSLQPPIDYSQQQTIKQTTLF